MGGVAGTAPISLKQTDFSVKHFAQMMGQPIVGSLNKWKMYGWLGVWRRNIGPLCGDSTV